MLLSFNVGNTHISVGLFKSHEQRPVRQSPMQNWKILTHPIGTPEEFQTRIKELLSAVEVPWKSVKAIVISSVVPQVTDVIRKAADQKTLYLIDSKWPFSFRITASPAHQIGTDRLVNAEAAVREYGAPCIVVDAGTATTICAISKNSQGNAEFLGGAIIPGMTLSMEALTKNTAQLFNIELVPPPHAIGTNTQEALRSGILLGHALLIDGMVARFKNEMGISQLPVIATGGIGPLMNSLCREITHLDPQLTLKGIAHLYESILSQ